MLCYAVDVFDVGASDISWRGTWQCNEALNAADPVPAGNLAPPGDIHKGRRKPGAGIFFRISREAFWFSRPIFVFLSFSVLFSQF